jgi:site-specific recombinase XerD
VDLENGILNLLVRKRRRILEAPLNDEALIMCFTTRRPAGSERTYGQAWKRHAARQGLHDVTWHTFRHTFASRLNGNGADLVTVKELLGHADIKTTMRYAHTNRDAKTKAVRRLGGGVTLTGPGTKSPKSA